MISMADLLKKEGGAGKAAGKEFKQLNKQIAAGVASGELVDDGTADRLVRDRIMSHDTDRGFILDGYPSNRRQVENLKAMLKDFGVTQPVTIHLDVPDAVVLARSKSRGRADDKAGFTADRLQRFRAEEAAILPLYPKIHRIDGSREPSQVWNDIRAAIDGK
jgi:adenylate kinase